MRSDIISHEKIGDTDILDIIEHSNLVHDLSALTSIEGDVQLKGVSQTEMNISLQSPFTVVTTNSGTPKIVHKPSLCWLFNAGHCQLSADRLVRVKESELTKYTEKTKNLRTECNTSAFIKECSEIHVDDWCLFKETNYKTCLLGLILHFVYLKGKTLKAQEFSSSYARIKDNTKEIGVMCSWYILDKKSGKIVPQLMTTHGYIAIEQYRRTISPPIIDGEILKISDDIYEEFKTGTENKTR